MQTQVQNYRVHMYTIRSTVFEDGSVDALRLCSGDGRRGEIRPSGFLGAAWFPLLLSIASNVAATALPP